MTVIEFLIAHNSGKFSVSSGQTNTKPMFRSIKELLAFYETNPLIDKQTDKKVELSEVRV